MIILDIILGQKFVIMIDKQTSYSVDSIKRTVHVAFHRLFSLLKIDFLKFFLATVFLIEHYT